MREDLSQLLVLQNRDQEIANLKAELARIPLEKERAHDRLAHDKKNLAEAKSANQENEIAIKNVELDIGTRRETLSRLKTQQFETRKNEEFTALAGEITRYSEQVDDLETQELELMEKGDTLKTAIQTAQDALDRTQVIVDEDLAMLDKRAAEDQARLDEVLAKRQEASQGLDEDLILMYERLFAGKNGIALAEVKQDHQCTGCHVKVTPATYIATQNGKDLAQCDNCGRILYVS